MQRQLLLLATLVGCGSVDNMAPDGPGAGPDAGPVTDPLTGSLRNGCVVALRMEETSWSDAVGQVTDDCGGDNPGTVVGVGTNTVAAGAHGRAASFAGTGCIEIPNADALHATTGLTMSAWIFPTAIDGGVNGANGIISKRIDANNESEYSMSVWLRNHVWGVVDGDAAADQLEGTTAITTQRWFQVTMVYDGTKAQAERMTLYVNGTFDTRHGETSATLPPYSSPLHVGCMPAPRASIDQNFVGQIDEVVVWNRALSDAEITQWYDGTRPR